MLVTSPRVAPPIACPLCRDEISPAGVSSARASAARTQGCSDCGTRYHLDCLSEFSGCSTLGCASFGLSPREVPRRRQRRAARCTRCSLEASVGELQPCAGCGEFAHPACASQGCPSEGCAFGARRARAPQPRRAPAARPEEPESPTILWSDLPAVLALAATLVALWVFQPSELILRGALLAICIACGAGEVFLGVRRAK